MHKRRMACYLPRSGFTLIEVLVVVAIIALLVAILIPSLSRARNQAKLVTCMSNLHQVSLATQTYLHQYRDHFPDPILLGGVFAREREGDEDGDGKIGDTFRLYPYRVGAGIKNPSWDPAAYAEDMGIAAIFQRFAKFPGKDAAWMCPDAHPETLEYGNSYAMNINRLLWEGSWSTLVMKNHSARKIWWLYDNYTFAPYKSGKRIGKNDRWSPLKARYYPHGALAPDSQNKANYIQALFLDGHVEWRKGN